MKHYTWEGSDSKGTVLKGRLEAASDEEAVAALRGQGVNVARIKPERESIWNREYQLKRSVKPFELLTFTRRLSFMLNTGLTFSKSLKALEDESDAYMRNIVVTLRRDTENGLSMANAMSRHPDVFNDLYVAMVHAGEESGNLPGVLDRLAHEMERRRRIVREIKAALAYPIMVAAFAFIIFLVMMTVLIPRFLPFFDQLGGGRDLPAYTQFMLEISGFFAPPDGGIVPVRPVLGLSLGLLVALVMYLVANLRIVQSRGVILIGGFAAFILGIIGLIQVDRLAISLGHTSVGFATAMRLGVFAVFILMIAIVMRMYLKTEDGKWVWDRLKLRLPVKIGPMILKATLARYCGLFGALYDARIQVDKALLMTGEASGSVVYKRASERAWRSLKDGAKVSTALDDSEAFPNFVIQMVDTGETSGKLDETMELVAQYYEEEVDEFVKNISSWLTPIAVVVVGVLVVAVLLALYLPLFGAYDALNSQVI
jgi:type II secretory pathway component PulF